MPTVTLTPSACTSPAGWTTLYNYLTTNSSYYPRQLIFTYPENAALGAAAKKTLAGLIPELAALIEAAEDALR